MLQSQYTSNLLEAFVEKTEQLNKNVEKTKSKGSSNSPVANSSTAKSSAKNNSRTTTGDTSRKRGRPAKSSSKTDNEPSMRLDNVVSNVSPDSGIQSNSGSPLYHGMQSPASYNTTSRSVSGSKSMSASTTKSMSLSQKVVLSASKKSSEKKNESKTKNGSIPEVRVQTNLQYLPYRSS